MIIYYNHVIIIVNINILSGGFSPIMANLVKTRDAKLKGLP